ncbi:uncharacterized protein LOC122070418 [Macadamia integrifolia]|uniref:uncharacterized protein LOC122070418 n=1 Tax=Macadamia integrifolia TaxID=60698 RepID=UPI001C4FDDC6|nr:uncharacterized protein LOC122070418 [Macadamia integrifolia]
MVPLPSQPLPGTTRTSIAESSSATGRPSHHMATLPFLGFPSWFYADGANPAILRVLEMTLEHDASLRLPIHYNCRLMMRSTIWTKEAYVAELQREVIDQWIQLGVEVTDDVMVEVDNLDTSDDDAQS